jgi:uncharacterized protein YcfL
MKQIFLLTVLCAMGLIGCSRHETATLTERANLFAEEVSNSAICADFKQQLLQGVATEQELTSIYQHALQKHCINSDI